MEKQQDILFSIVSENRNSMRNQSYPPQAMQMQQMNYQIDPFLRLSSENKVGSLNSSAFKPSKVSPNSDQTGTSIITPTPTHVQSNLHGLALGSQMHNGMNHVQLLTEICASLMGKQM